MDVTYAIIKVYVTERNDVIKRHRFVITIRRKSAIEMTAFFKKNLRSEINGVQKKKKTKKKQKKKKKKKKKEFIALMTSLVMPNSDPRDVFSYLLLTTMIDPYIKLF